MSAGRVAIAAVAIAAAARAVVDAREQRLHHVGFIGYGNTTPGDRVLLAVDSHYETQVVSAFVDELRRRGALVDVLTVDAGPDRPFCFDDEINVAIRQGSQPEARRWEGLPWIESLAADQGYDLLIHGKGGPIPQTRFRYEQIPWLGAEHLVSAATTFPEDLHRLINIETWNILWAARGGSVHIVDPEGTDLRYTLHSEYFDGSRRGFREEVTTFGHLHTHPPPPLLPQENASGVVAGTTSHYTRAFSSIRVVLQGGRIESIEGGSDYGTHWRALMQATERVQYPGFPRPGLFWLSEAALGTNPKVTRPTNIEMLSSGGFEWERRRSGVIHLGFGTRWGSDQEEWAAGHGQYYGHLHVHLLFPTVTVTAPDGTSRNIVTRGRLTALDDPKVRDCAAQYGDPDSLLAEDWIPRIPGVSIAGEYRSYAKDPASWVYRVDAGQTTDAS